MLYAADAAWWKTYAADALKFPGLKVTAQAGCVPFPAVFELKPTGSEGFDPDPSQVRTGLNSAYQALHIAMHAGAARVLLFGVDMQGINWHGLHPTPRLRVTSPKGFAAMLKCWPSLLPEIAARGVDVVNCSPMSALTCFRTSTLEREISGEPSNDHPAGGRAGHVGGPLRLSPY